jgi:pilus assembly protein CpaB
VSRRARVLALLGLSVVCGGTAASLVNGYVSDVRAQVGPSVPVVVASVDIPKGKALRIADLASNLSERSVPKRFAPPGAFAHRAEVAGLRTEVAIARGSYLLQSELRPPGARSTGATVPAARIVEVPVAGAGSLSGLVAPGARVDVLVTSDRGSGSPRTYLALQRVELVSLSAGAGGDVSDPGARAGEAVAALRVSLRQAVLLTAAQNFAREVRLVPRPAGDSRRLTGAAVTADELRP